MPRSRHGLCGTSLQVDAIEPHQARSTTETGCAQQQRDGARSDQRNEDECRPERADDRAGGRETPYTTPETVPECCVVHNTSRIANGE